MDSWLLDRTLGLLLPVALGVAGWWTTHWIANPLLAIYRMRAEVHEGPFRVANVGSQAGAAELREAQALLRGLAAKLSAANVAASRGVSRLIRLRGFDLPKAVAGLTGLSNSLRTDDGSRALHRGAAERGLRLPKSDSDEYLRKIEENFGTC